MSYIVLLFFFKSDYLRLCAWRISFWSYANCFNFVSLSTKETGLHNQALANEDELLERRCCMKLILEVLDLAGFSLCWSSCVLEVTVFPSSCFFPWLPGEEIWTSPSSLLRPAPFLYSLLVRFFFSWPRIWWRAPVVRIDSVCHQRSKTVRLTCIPSMETQLDNQLCSCFCYLGWS